VDPTADIKETFISETIKDGFEKFGQKLHEHAKAKNVRCTANGVETDKAQCSYGLDTSGARPVIRVMIASGDDRNKYEFTADAIGTGILNMKLAWREKTGGQLLSNDELAEFCFNEFLSSAGVVTA